MGVVLPGEPDTAVQLDRLARRQPQRLQGLGQRQPALLRIPRGVVGGRPGRLDLHVDVREPVLDRLERSDRPPELLARPDVLHGPIQRRPGRPDRLRGQHRGSSTPGRGERPEHALPVPEQLGRHVTQLHDPARPGLIDPRLPRPYEPPRVPPHEEQQHPAPGEAAGMRGHHQQPGTVPVEHLPDLPVQPPAAPLPQPGLHAPGPSPAGPLPPVVAGQPEGGGQSGPGHRLTGQREVHRTAPDAPVLLGDGEAGQPEPPRQLLPQPPVVPGRSTHGGLDLVRPAALAQDLAQGPAHPVLLRGEGGIHHRSPI